MPWTMPGVCSKAHNPRQVSIARLRTRLWRQRYTEAERFWRWPGPVWWVTPRQVGRQHWPRWPMTWPTHAATNARACSGKPRPAVHILSGPWNSSMPCAGWIGWATTPGTPAITWAEEMSNRRAVLVSRRAPRPEHSAERPRRHIRALLSLTPQPADGGSDSTCGAAPAGLSEPNPVASVVLLLFAVGGGPSRPERHHL
jgi:hypothetical protein